MRDFIVVTIIACLLLSGLFIGYPVYRVWAQEKRGQAAFKEAVHNRRIQVEEAQANLEAERLNAQAEVERAKGMAEAIEIENGKLTDMYIRYLWVRQLNSMNNGTSLIYIPTEGNIPIMEANRYSLNK